MITYVNSDIFSSPARVLVNTVNTEGVMGKGIALQFKKRYPSMYERYRDLAKSGQLSIGQLWLYRCPERWILNFPTKTTWRRPSRPEYIKAGLEKFVQTYSQLGIETISFPLLGCGNGELDWDQVVRPLMVTYLKPLPISIYIHVRLESSTFVAEHKEPDLFSQAAEPPSSFETFWSHIRQLAEQNPELRTYALGNPFRLAYVDEESLVFERQSARSVKIPREDLRDLWDRLQLSGSVSPGQAPGRIGREYGVVFPFLALLPYMDRVELSEDYEQMMTNPATGLQLRHASSKTAIEAELITSG